MVLSLSKTALFSIVLTGTLTSALVVPRGVHPVIPALDAHDDSGQHHTSSANQGTGHPYPTTVANSSSIAPETASLGTSCTTSSTTTVTLSGSSIVPLASQTGYYPTSEGSTIMGYSTNPSPSSNVLSSTMGYPAGPSVPPPQNPATSVYPAVPPTSMIIGPSGGGHGPVIASTFNTPMPYASDYATASVAPWPMSSLNLQGAQVSQIKYPTGTAPPPYLPIPTGYTTTSAYGTGYVLSSSIVPYPVESGVYISDSLAYPSPSSVSPVTPTPMVSSTVGVYVPISSLPPVPGNMTTQYSAGQPVASDYPEQPEGSVSATVSSTLQAHPSPALPFIPIVGVPYPSGYYSFNPIPTVTGGALYSSSSNTPLPTPTSAVMSNSSLAPSTMITSAITSSATSGVYDTPPQSTGGYGAVPNGVAYMDI